MQLYMMVIRFFFFAETKVVAHVKRPKEEKIKFAIVQYLHVQVVNNQTE